MNWRRLLGLEKRAQGKPPSSWDLLAEAAGSLPGAPHVHPDAVLSASSVAARCVDLRATLLASVPLFVFRNSDGGGRERADDVPLYGVLHDQFNDHLTAYEGREFLTRALDLAGNAYARLERDSAGQVTAIFPYVPNTVTVERLASGRLRYRVTPPTGGALTLLEEEVLHIRGPSRDGVMGLSPLAIARQNLSLMLSQAEAADGLARRGLRSSGFLETGQILDEGDRERLQEIVQEYAGAGRAGSVMVLEGGMSYKPLSWSPEDAELLASRKLSNEDVARIFGIPPTCAGIGEHATFDNVENEGIALVVRTLAPLARRVETAIARACLSAEARRALYVEHDLNGLARGDMKARFEAYRIGREIGVYSSNDIRRRENDPPIPNGDGYLQPLNMTPLGTPPTAPAPAD